VKSTFPNGGGYALPKKRRKLRGGRKRKGVIKLPSHALDLFDHKGKVGRRRVAAALGETSCQKGTQNNTEEEDARPFGSFLVSCSKKKQSQVARRKRKRGNDDTSRRGGIARNRRKKDYGWLGKEEEKGEAFRV